MKRGRLTREYERLTPRTVWHRARMRGSDPRVDCPFGALAVEGHFPEYQLATVQKMQDIRKEWFQHLEMNPSPASPSFEIGSGRSPIAIEDEQAIERAELAKRAYNRMEEEMKKFLPGLRFAIEELIFNERAVTAEWLPHVKVGLDTLAVAMGYKPRKKTLDKSRRVSD